MSEKEKMFKEMMEAHAESMIKYQQEEMEKYANPHIRDYAEGYIAGIKCMMSAFKYFNECLERFYPNETKK